MHQVLSHFTGLENEQSSTFLSLHLRHRSFSNPSVALPASQLILQPLRCFTYVTTHSPTLLSLYLRHSSFCNPYVASPTSQLIFQPFSCFTYVTAHSPTLPSHYVRHNSFSNPSVASPTSQLILQPFFRFSYLTGFSLTSPGEPPMQYMIHNDVIMSLLYVEILHNMHERCIITSLSTM